jgi:hypothetical protein
LAKDKAYRNKQKLTMMEEDFSELGEEFAVLG